MSEDTVPRSWAEAIHRLAYYVGGEPTATEWIRQACEARFGPSKDMSRVQRSLAFQKTCGAILRLQDEGKELVFDLEVRRITRQAFARFFDGVIVEGPAWRLSPYEDRPLYEDWLDSAVSAI